MIRERLVIEKTEGDIPIWKRDGGRLAEESFCEK